MAFFGTRPHLVIGLTGSIGMGKSTASRQLRQLGVPVHDADAVVHQLMKRNGAAFEPLAAAFPQAVGPHGMERRVLGTLAFNNHTALKTLENILHPLVRRVETFFLQRCQRMGHNLVVLDIPLLFETGAHHRCDCVIVVTAPAFLQRQRVLRRSGMTSQRLESILALQMPDSQKRKHADYIVPTGLGLRYSLEYLVRIMKELKENAPDRFGY